MPTAIGTGSRRHGIEKKVPNAYGVSCRNHVSDQQRRRRRSGRVAPVATSPNQRPAQIISTRRNQQQTHSIDRAENDAERCRANSR